MEVEQFSIKLEDIEKIVGPMKSFKVFLEK